MNSETHSKTPNKEQDRRILLLILHDEDPDICTKYEFCETV